MIKYIIFLLVFLSCSANPRDNLPDEKTLSFYTQYSKYTDPGEYAYLYDNLPESIERLCKLIKCQLIHPIEAGQFNLDLPDKHYMEDTLYVTVQDILRGLIEKNDAGLTFDRKPEERLVIACYHHSMLLASILRHRGIPVRMRAGYARYYEVEHNVRFSHVICEVWNKSEQRWMLVDPDREKVDFSLKLFEYPHKSWVKYRDGKMGKTHYVASSGKGAIGIPHLLGQDLSCLVMEEKPYWFDIPIAVQVGEKSMDSISKEDNLILDELANLLRSPTKNFNNLIEFHDSKIILQHIEIPPHEYFKRSLENY